MIHINDIASWFSKNNEFCSNDEERIYLLCCLTIFAFRLNDINVDYKEVNTEDSYSLGIYDYDSEYSFNSKEKHLLQFVNHKYGYFDIDYLKSMLNMCNKSLDECFYYLEDILSLHLKEYESYEFDDYVYIGKNNVVFFVSNDCVLDEDDKDSLDKLNDFENQRIFYVRKEDGGSLVVF